MIEKEELKELSIETKKCLDCISKSCDKGCALNISVSSFLKEIALENFDKASTIIRADNPLPSVCSSYCYFSESCMNYCAEERPINIAKIEKKLIENTYMDISRDNLLSDKFITIIGAGVSGLTLALLLAKKGAIITIYDSNNIGGQLINEAAHTRELARNISLITDELRSYNVSIMQQKMVDKNKIIELSKFSDSVYLCPGLDSYRNPSFVLFENEYVINAYTFLNNLNNNLMEYKSKIEKIDGPIVCYGGPYILSELIKIFGYFKDKEIIVLSTKKINNPFLLSEMDKLSNIKLINFVSNVVSFNQDQSGLSYIVCNGDKTTYSFTSKLFIFEPEKSFNQRIKEYEDLSSEYKNIFLYGEAKTGQKRIIDIVSDIKNKF